LRVLSTDLEDRIRELCAKAVASDDTDFQSVTSELRSAMREHIERVRKMAVQQLAEERQRRNRAERE
jgi:hypothetical protein